MNQVRKSIGSGTEADIRLSSKFVSSKHAILVRENQKKVYIEGLNSTFGTYVNGKKIKARTELKERDRVKIGTQLFHWKDHLFASEKEETEIFLKDLFLPTGFVSWENYKIILIIALGATIIIPLGIPTVLFFLEYRLNKHFSPELQLSFLIKPSLIIITMIAAYIFLNLTQKALRSKFKNQT